MLAQAGLLTDDRIAKRLSPVKGDEIVAFPRSRRELFPFRTGASKTFTCMWSRRLIARTGDVGRKLHTARSRNDQVATDLKLFVRDAAAQIDGLLEKLQRAFVARSARDLDVIVPGLHRILRYAAPAGDGGALLARLIARSFPERDRGRLERRRSSGSTFRPWVRRPWPEHRCPSIGS